LSYTAADLRSRWIDESAVMYFGKAAKLQKRVKLIWDSGRAIARKEASTLPG